MTKIVLLGPQHYHATLGDVIESLGLSGSLAVITAGWQERETEWEELEVPQGRENINLMLHQRGEEIFREDAELREAHQAHQEHLKSLQVLYRLRLTHVQGVVRELMNRREFTNPDVLEPEIDDAVEAIRDLDRHHLARIREANRVFQEQWGGGTNVQVMNHHFELAEILKNCSAVLIAGGHVAVLLNRIRLLKLESLIEDKLVIAWSAGAMVLGEQVVLFHDTPPQGSGHAEVFESGLGLFKGVLPLPHARKRLLLEDPVRVSIFARRFAHLKCLTMEDGARIEWNEKEWHSAVRITRLTGSGEHLSLEAS